MWSKIPSTQFSNSPFFGENFREVTLRVLWLLLSRLLFPKSATVHRNSSNNQPSVSSIKLHKTILHCRHLTNSSYVFFRPFPCQDNVFLLIHYFRWDKRCMKIEDVVEIQNRTLVSQNYKHPSWLVRNQFVHRLVYLLLLAFLHVLGRWWHMNIHFSFSVPCPAWALYLIVKTYPNHLINFSFLITVQSMKEMWWTFSLCILSSVSVKEKWGKRGTCF